jgi:hypothetical protein
MELVEIIMRVIYLVFLYAVLFLVLKYNTNLFGNALQALSFFGAVLVLYITFPYVYEFLLNNELIFQLKLSSQKDGEEEKEESAGSGAGSSAGSTSTKISNELNVSNERNEINSNVSNHTHKFLVDKVFQ